jgi:hypothetical protein
MLRPFADGNATSNRLAALFKSWRACQISARPEKGNDMAHKQISGLIAAVLVLAPGAAWAGHGKAGLWNTSSTTNMALAMPPDVAAKMKAMGMAMPKAQTFNSQMCMSQAEVDSSSPPHIDQGATGCTSKVVSATASSMTAQMTCNGRMKGTGTMKISYRGNEHYEGSYDFKGTVEGNPTNMSTTFKGDWVKADCGSVKPYALRTQ